MKRIRSAIKNVKYPDCSNSSIIGILNVSWLRLYGSWKMSIILSIYSRTRTIVNHKSCTFFKPLESLPELVKNPSCLLHSKHFQHVSQRLILYCKTTTTQSAKSFYFKPLCPSWETTCRVLLIWRVKYDAFCSHLAQCGMAAATEALLDLQFSS